MKREIRNFARGLALAAFAWSGGAQAAVSLTNGSFETIGVLYNGAIGGLYEAVGWVNLSTNLNFQASSMVAANPPNPEWTSAAGSSAGSRTLRLCGDSPIYLGAVAQVVGTMQANHTYYVSADAYGGPSAGTTYQVTLALVNEAAGVPSTIYASSFESGIASGELRPMGVSYTATPSDEGNPLVVFLRTDIPASGTAYSGSIDSVILSDNSPIPPHILVQPSGATAAIGGSYSMSVKAGGPPALSYQWYKGASSIADATNATLSFPSLTLGDAANYKVVVANAGGSVTSSVATLAVNSVSLVNGSFESTGALLLNAIGGLYQPTGWTNLSTALGGLDFQASSAVAANPPNGEWTAPAGSATGSRVLRMCGDFPVHQGAEAQVVGLMQSNHTYYLTADIYGGPSTGTNYQVTLGLVSDPSTTPTTTYASVFSGGIASGQIVPTSLSYTAGAADHGNQLVVLIYTDIPISGQAFQGTLDHVQLQDNTPVAPYVLRNPAGFTNSLGASGSLRVVGGGTAPTFQWLKGGSPVPGATTSTLLFPSLGLGDSGSYAAVVTAGGNSVTSSVAAVEVLAVPVAITQQPTPASAVVLSGSKFSATVGVSNTASQPVTYQWYLGAGQVPGATTATLTIPSVSGGNAGTYTVVIANPVNVLTSAPAVLAIGTLPNNITNYQGAIRAEPSLISEYTFDLGNANDSVGPNNGTMVGTAVTRNSTSLAGGANQVLQVDARGFADLGTVSDFEFTDGDGTIEALVRADWSAVSDGNNPWASPPYNPCLFKCGSGGVRWAVYMLQNKSQLVFWNGGAAKLVSIPAPGTNWHHIVSVFDMNAFGTNWTVYWDNVPVYSDGAFGVGTSVPTLVGASTPNFLGGAWGTLATEGWIGAFDEVALYSTALSASQVNAHYSALHAGDVPVVTTQPQSVVALPGESITLSAGIAGPNLNLQWYKNGVPIPGATGSQSLHLSSLTGAAAGRYLLAASNPYGSTTTAEALVTVTSPSTGRYLSSVAATPGLVSLYTFDAGDYNDSIGGNHGTSGSGGFDPIVFEPWIGGGTNILLDQASYVELGLVPAFQFTNGIGSVEAMVRADWPSDSLTAGDPYIVACRGGLGTSWGVRMIQSKTQVGLYNGTGTAWFSIPDPGTNWHHMVAVFQVIGNSKASLYWDDALLGTVDFALGAGAGATTQIGNGLPTALNQPWGGAIDNVAFYNRALAGTEVNAHYTSLAGLNPTITRSGSQVTLSWPASTPGGVLEGRAHLATGSWLVVPGVTNNSVTLNATGTSGFFRVHLQ